MVENRDDVGFGTFLEPEIVEQQRYEEYNRGDDESDSHRERLDSEIISQAAVSQNPDETPVSMFDTLVAALEQLARDPDFHGCEHRHDAAAKTYYFYDPNTNFRVDASYGVSGMQYRLNNIDKNPQAAAKALQKIHAAAPNLVYDVKLTGNLDACVASAKLLIAQYGADNLKFAFSDPSNPTAADDFESKLKAALPAEQNLQFISPPHNARRLR